MDLIVASKDDLRQIVSDTIRTTLPELLAGMNKEEAGPKSWLTNKEAMAYLGLSKATLARYRASGILPYSKVGGNIYYKFNDVVALLEKNTTS